MNGAEIASNRRAAKGFGRLTKLPMSKSSLVRLVNECGGSLVAEQAAEAEAMVKAPERGEKIVWRDIPEPDSEVIPLATKNA